MNDLAVRSTATAIAAPSHMSASYMTKQLKLLGSGSMEEGIRILANAIPSHAAAAIHNHGFRLGIIKGRVEGGLFAGACVTTVLFVRGAIKSHRTRSSSNNAGKLSHKQVLIKGEQTMNCIKADSNENLGILLRILRSNGINEAKVITELDADGTMEFSVEVPLEVERFTAIVASYDTMRTDPSEDGAEDE